MTNAKKIALEQLAMKEIYSKALERMDMGRKDYGIYDPLTDKRDMFEEAEQELLDAINYLCMEIRRIRRLSANVENMIKSENENIGMVHKKR